MIQSISHIALRVRDVEKTLNFYTRVLGLKEAFRLQIEKDTEIVYIKVAKNSFIEVFPAKNVDRKEEHTNKQGFIHLCLAVDNMEKTLKELKDKGIDVGEPKKGVDNNYQYWIKDPDGNPIELMEISPDSPQARS